MRDFPIPLDLLAIKATMVLVVAMLLALALRRGSGQSRHLLWTTTSLALLALPALELVVPQFQLAWIPDTLTASADPNEEFLPLAIAAASVDQLVDLPAQVTIPDIREPITLGGWLALAWLVGIVAVAAPILVGVVRSRRLIRTASRNDDPRLAMAFDSARRLVGVRAPVSLRITSAVRTPMTGGVMHPTVILPSAAIGWSDDCLDAVLRHELVHVRQRDALRQLCARFAVALYWFHPLAWRAARLGALAREMACDEAVLRLGTRPSRYARHLLDLADPLPAPVAPALVRLDHPHLEERVKAILRATPAATAGRHTIMAATLLIGWTALVAAASPEVPPAAAEESAPAVTTLDIPAAEAEFPVVEIPAVRADDCEFTRDGTTRSGEGGGPVRTFTTDHEGTRICAAVRGVTARTGTFLPRGTLDRGVIVTLASQNADGVRRLEIEGGNSGNTHRWYVDGRSRPFDRAAEEWRDAMYDTIEAIARLSADEQRQVEVARIAERTRDLASAAERRAREVQAMQRDAEVAAGVVERRSVEAARLAERRSVEAMRLEERRAVETMRAMEMDRRAAEVRAGGVGRTPRAVVAPSEIPAAPAVGAMRRPVPDAPAAPGTVIPVEPRVRVSPSAPALEEPRLVEARARSALRETERDRQESERQAVRRMRELEARERVAPVIAPSGRGGQRDRLDPRIDAAVDRLNAAIRATG